MIEKYFIIPVIILSLICAAIIIISLGIGAVFVTPSTVLKVLTGQITEGTEVIIIMQLRLPRILLAAFIGGGLAAAGTAFQGMFRNPLADPFVVGASGGAALGATAAIVTGFSWKFMGMDTVPLAAFTGAVGAVLLVYSIADSGGRCSAGSLLLAGIALSTILSSAVSLIMILSDATLHETYTWLMGGLSGRGWPELRNTVPFIIIGALYLLLLSRPLDALASGEETAVSLGLPVRRTRILIVSMASLATAAAVAAGGIIGFIGLVAPHIARLFFGSAHRKVMPASILIGAILLVVADDIARTVMAPVELPAGIVTSMTGGVFFIYLLKTKKNEL